MNTIGRSGIYELTERKSRFLCALARVTTEDEVRDFIRQRRKEHYDAGHHCSAYVLGDDGTTQKSSDDGEPAGTAGVPMLEVLRRNNITNVVAVVTRYFGGVKLGAGGLIRAYGSAVSDALEHVGIVERREFRVVSVTADHASAGKLENHLRSAGYHVADVHYTDQVRFDVHVDADAVADFDTWLAGITAGTAQVSLGALLYSDVPM